MLSARRVSSFLKILIRNIGHIIGSPTTLWSPTTLLLWTGKSSHIKDTFEHRKLTAEQKRADYLFGVKLVYSLPKLTLD